MAINRRDFLRAGAGLGLSSLVACDSSVRAGSVLLSGYQTRQAHGRTNGVAIADLDGRLRAMVTLPQRVHQILALDGIPRPIAESSLPANGQCVAISRRPGTHLYNIDYDRGRLLATIEAKAGRHFYGHACTNARGYVLVPQNHIGEQAASIAVYDPADRWRLLGELALPGIGPHQIGCLADGRTLVVAMGGIYTQPLTGRKKLNLSRMQSSLVYMDSDTGALLGEYYPPARQLSLRHLTIGADDRVIVAAQYQGDPDHILPLAFSHQGEEVLQPFRASDDHWRQHQQYVGSVSIDSQGRWAYLSSPRAGLISRWQLDNLNADENLYVRDACGLGFSSERQCFYISNGLGQLVSHRPIAAAADAAAKLKPVDVLAVERGLIWDNHLTIS